MAFSSGFYNSIDHDRTYSATQFGEMFDGLINDGIYATIGNAFAVVPGTGIAVLVKSGRAWFNKTWSVNTSDLPIELDMPDLLLPRIDAIILEVDTRISVRNNSIKKITGITSVNPVKPELIRADGLYQYPLAYISVNPNASTITKTDIENAIGISPTPFVTGILESIPIDDLWNQWEGQFKDWFDGIKSQLSDDIATNLLHQIKLLSEKVDDSLMKTDKAITSQISNASDVDKYVNPSTLYNWFYNNKATAVTSNTKAWVPASLLETVENNLTSNINNLLNTLNFRVAAYTSDKTGSGDESLGSFQVPTNIKVKNIIVISSINGATGLISNIEGAANIDFCVPVTPGEYLNVHTLYINNARYACVKRSDTIIAGWKYEQSTMARANPNSSFYFSSYSISSTYIITGQVPVFYGRRNYVLILYCV